MFEYEAQMYAYNLKEVDKRYDMHVQAWINHQVTGTKKKGKKEVPLFKTFDEFFDYEKQINQIENKKEVSKAVERDKEMARLFKRIGERRVNPYGNT